MQTFNKMILAMTSLGFLASVQAQVTSWTICTFNSTEHCAVDMICTDGCTDVGYDLCDAMTCETVTGLFGAAGECHINTLEFSGFGNFSTEQIHTYNMTCSDDGNPCDGYNICNTQYFPSDDDSDNATCDAPAFYYGTNLEVGENCSDVESFYASKYDNFPGFGECFLNHSSDPVLPSYAMITCSATVGSSSGVDSGMIFRIVLGAVLLIAAIVVAVVCMQRKTKL